MMWEVLTFFALFFTLVAVIWYAWETRSLRTETVKQTELSLRPFVTLIFDENKEDFYIKNIGNSPALNTYIEEIPIINEEGELYISYLFEKKDIIEPNEMYEVGGEIKMNEASTSNIYFMSHFNPRSAVRSYEYVIHYDNINNEAYQTKGKFGEGGIRITETGKSS